MLNKGCMCLAWPCPPPRPPPCGMGGMWRGWAAWEDGMGAVGCANVEFGHGRDTADAHLHALAATDRISRAAGSVPRRVLHAKGPSKQPVGGAQWPGTGCHWLAGLGSGIHTRLPNAGGLQPSKALWPCAPASGEGGFLSLAPELHPNPTPTRTPTVENQGRKLGSELEHATTQETPMSITSWKSPSPRTQPAASAGCQAHPVPSVFSRPDAAKVVPLDERQTCQSPTPSAQLRHAAC